MHKTGAKLWWCWGAAGVLFAAIVALSGAPGWTEVPSETPEAAAMEFRADPQLALSRSPLFTEAESIVQSRCSMCHARKPLWPGLVHPPKNVVLETGRDIVLNASLIERQAVRSHAMPPGNLTGIEPGERLALARWIRSGDGLGRP